MRPADSLMRTRKSHSATKISEVDQVLLSCEFNSNRRISCASASCYSSRAKARNSKCFNVFSDESQESFKSIDSGKQKLFLYASQVLVKLKNINKNYIDSNDSKNEDVRKPADNSPQDKNFKVSFRKINFYHDLLKRLLEERCIFLLKEESKSCVIQTQKLISDLKTLYANEVVKLTTMPIKSYNRFIDCTGISISILEQLVKKVNNVCDLHSSLKNNYHNIINFFHVGFDMELNHLILKMNKFQSYLYSEMFYWTHKILETFILKLCLADPDSLSPEFLLHVVETCESFNLLFFDKKQLKYAYLANTYHVLFNFLMQSDYEAILLDFILQYLSHFEAKVAAEKIIQYLIHECKNRGHGIIKDLTFEREKRDIGVPSSNTSDYYSSSPTVAEIEISNQNQPSANGNSNIDNVFINVIQRNQSLVLKYLYSIMCLDISTPIKNKKNNRENYSDSFTVNKAWNLPQTGFKNRSYQCLEERYWNRFWEKVLAFCLKLILEVPCHQYGNTAVGIYLFWPQSYHHIIFKFLKYFAESKDIPPAGLNVMKKILHSLVFHNIQESWDKNMSSALSLIHGQQYTPIPVANNGARTRIGNALCLCIESLGSYLLHDLILLEYPQLKLVYPFQVTLDCFVHVTNSKIRASSSSGDISTYLLISRSDCVYACNLLEESTKNYTSPRNFISLMASDWKKTISQQTDILVGHITDTPNVIHRIISEAVRKTYKYNMSKKHWWICNYSNTLPSNMFFCDLNEVLSSFTDIIDHIHDAKSVLSSVTSAVVNTLFQVLYSFRRIISPKKTEVLKRIFLEFLKWLEHLKIKESEIEELKEMKCLKRLVCVFHILEVSEIKPRRFLSIRNRIAPSITAFPPEEFMVLNEEERNYWHGCHRNNFIVCS